MASELADEQEQLESDQELARLLSSIRDVREHNKQVLEEDGLSLGGLLGGLGFLVKELTAGLGQLISSAPEGKDGVTLNLTQLVTHLIEGLGKTFTNINVNTPAVQEGLDNLHTALNTKIVPKLIDLLKNLLGKNLGTIVHYTKIAVEDEPANILAEIEKDFSIEAHKLRSIVISEHQRIVSEALGDE
eukprot:gene7379-8598_t